LVVQADVAVVAITGPKALFGSSVGATGVGAVGDADVHVVLFEVANATARHAGDANPALSIALTFAGLGALVSVGVSFTRVRATAQNHSKRGD